MAKAKTSVITEEVVSETAVVEPIVKKSKPKPRLNLSSKSIAKSAVKSGKSNRKSFQKLRSKVPVNK